MACIYIPTPAIGCIKVMLIGLFFACVTFIVTFFFSRQYIMDNWDQYRCNPLVIPFAATFGHDSSKTLQECLTGNFVAMAPEIHAPFFNVFGGLSGGMLNLSNIMSDIHLTTGFHMDSFNFGLSNILDKLGDFGGAMHYLVIKLETLLQRLVATIAVIMYSMSMLLQGITSTRLDKDLQKMISKIIGYITDAAGWL
jgi:hypothetical protein